MTFALGIGLALAASWGLGCLLEPSVTVTDRGDLAQLSSRLGEQRS